MVSLVLVPMWDDIFFSRLVYGIGGTWIGGTDVVVEGEYKWADGEAFTWPDFLSVPAPVSNTAKNCIIAIGSLRWEQRSCAEKLPILCEVEIGMFYEANLVTY